MLRKQQSHTHSKLMKSLISKSAIALFAVALVANGLLLRNETARADDAPFATTVAATDITQTDATLHGTNGPSAAGGHSFWVSTAPFDTSSPVIPAGVHSSPDMGAIDAETDFSVSLSSITSSGVPDNLPAITPGTTYYFVAWTMVEGTWYPGDQLSFSTADDTPPGCVGTTSFDSDSLGSVNGQSGWISTGGYDQEVVDNTYGIPSFGCKSLRLSNAVTSGAFGDQTFSPSNANEAGEVDSTSNGYSGGVRQNHFEAQFDFASTQADQQPGLFVSVSPDRGDGSRMSYVGLSDEADGITVNFYDVPTTSNPADFTEHVLAEGLSRTAPHTVKFVIDYLNGPSNDVVTIYVDGVEAYTGTSWENYYRYDSEASAEQSPRTTDNLIFRVSGDAAPDTLGEGFLFDNYSSESSDVDQSGTIAIRKYACPEGTAVTRSANGIDGSVPEGCVPQAGAYFGYVHGTQTDANPPYPELGAELTAGGMTSGSGKLDIEDLAPTGRYLVVETDAENVQLPADQVLGLYCEGDGDTSDNNDNQELTFVPFQGTTRCVAYDAGTPSTLTVIKHVINDHGRTSVASDFIMHVEGADVSMPSFAGSEEGTAVTLNAGAYDVTESGPEGYAASYSEECYGTIGFGESRTCTVTNDDVAPETGTLIVRKEVVNDSGGTKVAGDFTMTVTGTNPSASSFPGDSEGVSVTLEPGSYSVDELDPGNYDKTLGEACSGTIEAGETVICVITNDDKPQSQTGGGSGGGRNGSSGGSIVPVVTGEVLGAATEDTGSDTCAALLTSYLRMGSSGTQVQLLQDFLNKEMSAHLPVTGWFGPLTLEVVKAFQLKYADEILKPWYGFGLQEGAPTGYVYKTTLTKINNLSCASLNQPVPALP